VQAGHWHIADLPLEQWRLRPSTGTRFGRLQEVDVNLEVARRVVSQLQDAGVSAELLPATVPPGYEADAFVAVHADGGDRSSERGWKVASPWRSSAASRLLRDSVASSYAVWTGMPEDRYGVTFNMRGYYAFSWYRFLHAVAPATPSMIIEAGFLSSEADRRLLSGDPDRAARGISTGVLLYLARQGAPRPESLVPRAFPPMRVAAPGAALRLLPGDGERTSRYLAAGTLVRPVGEEKGWVDLIVWGNYRVFGWMRESDLEPVSGA
jgi:N-acetylmuramoyl-L-alanine amidase